MFIPKTLDQSVVDGAHSLFTDAWLAKPDDAVPPTPSTPMVEFPPSGAYPLFATNFERYAAQELHKRLNPDEYQRKGFMMQAIAAGWHHKSKEQLREIADKVGRERIMVLHGNQDKMISLPHGLKLIEELEPGIGEVRDGIGHVFMVEETTWMHEMLEKLIEKTERLEK